MKESDYIEYIIDSEAEGKNDPLLTPEEIVLFNEALAHTMTDHAYNLITQLREKTDYYANHSIRVAMLSTLLLIKFIKIYHREDLIELGFITDHFIASLLHDVGKMKVSTEILHKEGSLTKEERDIMREHVRESIDIIRTHYLVDGVITNISNILNIVGGHHEWQKDAYPRNTLPKQQEIHIEKRNTNTINQDIRFMLQRILAIADSTDALLHGRSYIKDKNTKPLEEFIEECVEDMASDEAETEIIRMIARLSYEELWPKVNVLFNQTMKNS